MRLLQNQGRSTEGQMRSVMSTCRCRAPHMTTGAQFWLHNSDSQDIPSPILGELRLCIACLVLHKLLRPCATGPLGKVGRAVEREVYMVCAGESDTCVIGFESHFAANS